MILGPTIEGFFDFRIPNPGLAGSYLALAFMANGLLLMNVNSRFIKHKKSGMDMGQIRNSIENKAAASVASAIAGTISFLILQFGAVVVADSIFGLPAWKWLRNLPSNPNSVSGCGLNRRQIGPTVGFQAEMMDCCTWTAMGV